MWRATVLTLFPEMFPGPLGLSLAGDALAPIANWPDGKMAIAELDRGGRHLLLTGFPPDRAATDWPAQPSFVPFVHCAVRWLGAVRDTHTDWRVGDARFWP